MKLLETKLEKRYGLATAISLVIGIVIGSGVFFKTEKILQATEGNLALGIAAWILGGLVMIVCAYTFSILAVKYEYVNGLVDYAQFALGENYAFYVGWFMAAIYYPALTSALAWVSARYTCILLNISVLDGHALAIAMVYLSVSFAINALAPILAGKLQVATTVIKLIPLILMAVVGTIFGFYSGNAENIIYTPADITNNLGLLTATVSSAFAYEGWIIATTINSELRDAKKNLPRALIAGTITVVIVYVLYYIGLTLSVGSDTLMYSGEAGAKIAFENIFKQYGGTVLFVFVVVSCLGTLNGLMLGCTRGIYSIAVRGRGPSPKLFSRVDKKVKMPLASAILGLMLSAFWLLYYYGSNLKTPWFGLLSFDTTELPVITIYASFIPIFIMLIKKEKNLNLIKRFVVPIVAILGCLFMIFAAVYSHKTELLGYFVLFAIIMIFGKLLDIVYSMK